MAKIPYSGIMKTVAGLLLLGNVGFANSQELPSSLEHKVTSQSLQRTLMSDKELDEVYPDRGNHATNAKEEVLRREEGYRRLQPVNSNIDYNNRGVLRGTPEELRALLRSMGVTDVDTYLNFISSFGNLAKPKFVYALDWVIPIKEVQEPVEKIVQHNVIEQLN